MLDNNFDMPDRTFHSLATTWRLITNDSPTDVKELIPELFYQPELFHNNEGKVRAAQRPARTDVGETERSERWSQGWSWACANAARRWTTWSCRPGRPTRASSR